MQESLDGDISRLVSSNQCGACVEVQRQDSIIIFHVTPLGNFEHDVSVVEGDSLKIVDKGEGASARTINVEQTHVTGASDCDDAEEGVTAVASLDEESVEIDDAEALEEVEGGGEGEGDRNSGKTGHNNIIISVFCLGMISFLFFRYNTFCETDLLFVI